MFAPNCIDYALVFHACSLSGIIVSPVAPNFQAAELKQQMQVVISQALPESCKSSLTRIQSYLMKLKA